MPSFSTKGRDAPVRSVQYDSSSHVQILFQMYGSVWPKVLPFCLYNVLVTVIVSHLHRSDTIDLTISGQGHKFMNLIVSFLVVTRSTTVISRFMEMRAHLSNILKAGMELVTSVGALTNHETDNSVKEWRNDVAYHTMLVMRVVVSVLHYSSSSKNAWDVPELGDDEKNFLHRTLYLDTAEQDKCFQSNNSPAMRWSQGHNETADENFRVPRLMATRLKRTIMDNRKCVKEKLPAVTELKFLGYVDAMLDGYEGLIKILTTPIPFPMVQMGRTFLFFYVFSLPFALSSDADTVWADVMIVFIITFGFIGIEYVSMELSDPFGHDTNDFDCFGITKRVYEFIYAVSSEHNGIAYTDILRAKMSSAGERESALNEDHFPVKMTN